MAIDNSFIIKKLQGLPEMFVIFSQSTKHPYVTCNEESFDDQIHIFSDAEAAHAYVVAKNEQEKIPVVSVRVAAEQSRVHCTRLAGQKADNWWLRQCPKVLNLPFIEGIRRADRDNAIDVYIGDEYMDVLADGAWQKVFTEKPEVFTKEEKRAWLDQMQDVTLGSDAFFPFSDNIERAHKSGVKYIAEPGGSVRDDLVIETCDKYNMAMAFTGIRLFHH